ncbi:MAG: response regulator [Longimicrobiales bacterium]
MPDGQVPRGTETILVVDDDQSVRESVCRVLESLGYKTLQAESPADAVRIAKLTTIDLLLVDVILPMMSGLELAHSVSAIRPATRVLYMSGFTTDEVLGDKKGRHHLMGFLDKPFSPEELGSKVRTLLDTEFPNPLPTRPNLDGQETILVVDDDDSVRSTVTRLLGRLGYRVFEAGDPDQAMRLVLQGDVDLIVMDVVLPRLNGLALAHTISALRPSIRMLYISGYSRAELAGQFGLPDPGVAFLQKPFNPEGIGALIRSMLDRADADAAVADFH